MVIITDNRLIASLWSIRSQPRRAVRQQIVPLHSSAFHFKSLLPMEHPQLGAYGALPPHAPQERPSPVPGLCAPCLPPARHTSETTYPTRQCLAAHRDANTQPEPRNGNGTERTPEMRCGPGLSRISPSHSLTIARCLVQSDSPIPTSQRTPGCTHQFATWHAGSVATAIPKIEDTPRRTANGARSAISQPTQPALTHRKSSTRPDNPPRDAADPSARSRDSPEEHHP